MKAPIVIVEDSEEDYEAIAESLVRAGVLVNQMIRFHSGMELSAFLKQANRRKPFERPVVILLDLNLPGLSGHAILSDIIRKDEQLSSVPVVMFSTSSSPRDINLAYANGANSYLIKPLTLDEFDGQMARFKSYWFETVVPPLSAC